MPGFEQRVRSKILQNAPQWPRVALLAPTRLTSVMHAICKIATRTLEHSAQV